MEQPLCQLSGRGVNADTGAEEAGPDVGFELILFQPRKRG